MSAVAILSAIWVVITGIVSLVMWAAQVSPDQAQSNLYGWLIKAGISDPPQWLRNRAADRTIRNTAAIIILLLAVAGGMLLDSWIREVWISTTVSPTPLARDQELQRVSVDNQRGRQSVISYHAVYVISGRRLRVFLDYQAAVYNVEIKPMRVQLAEITDFVKNGELVISVVTRDDRPNGSYVFRWGVGEKDEMLFLRNYRCRIVLVDDTGKEQRFYFLLTGGSAWNTAQPGNGLVPYPDFVPVEYLNFAQKWEELD